MSFKKNLNSNFLCLYEAQNPKFVMSPFYFITFNITRLMFVQNVCSGKKSPLDKLRWFFCRRPPRQFYGIFKHPLFNISAKCLIIESIDPSSNWFLKYIIQCRSNHCLCMLRNMANIFCTSLILRSKVSTGLLHLKSFTVPIHISPL